MHKSALEAGKLFFETYWNDSFRYILDIGSQDVNGTLRSVKPANAKYLGVDMVAGAGVDLVLEDPHALPFEDQSFDIIVSTSCLEHDPLFWLSVSEMCRVVKPGGFIYINVPSNGVYHGYPLDYWRFYPDAAIGFVEWSQRLEMPVCLVESFVGPKTSEVWADTVMVFIREPFERVMPEILICDKLTNVSNIRRNGSTVLERFRAVPEDLRELRDTSLKLLQAKNEVAASRQRENELVAEIARLRNEISAIKSYKLDAEARCESSSRQTSYLATHLNEHTIAQKSVNVALGSSLNRDNEDHRCYPAHDPFLGGFKSAFAVDFLREYQMGVMSFEYKGIPCLKSPIDLAIYTKLIWDLKPGSVIELGSNAGGSALWLADTLERFSLEAKVYSIDINPPVGITHPRIKFLRGDVGEVATLLTEYDLLNLPRPWLVIEDSAHTYDICLAVLNQMAELLQQGDCLVMEDGVLEELGLSKSYDGGPNRALKDWFLEHPTIFSVERKLCDMFGFNATYAPNAWLRRN